jgi:hypothetical protein
MKMIEFLSEEEIGLPMRMKTTDRTEKAKKAVEQLSDSALDEAEEKDEGNT